MYRTAQNSTLVRELELVINDNDKANDKGEILKYKYIHIYSNCWRLPGILQPFLQLNIA